MLHRLILVIPLAITAAIKVPVEDHENINDSSSKPSTSTERAKTIDSYLIPPSPHEDQIYEGKDVPLTYLVPPYAASPNTDYYAQAYGEQTDWYPIPNSRALQVPYHVANQTEELPKPIRQGRIMILPKEPSLQLEPPDENAKNDFIKPPISVFGAKKVVPMKKPIFKKVSPKIIKLSYPKLGVIRVSEPLPQHRMRPKLTKFPTKLYPKKYSRFYKPIPIPIAAFASNYTEVPMGRAVNIIKPADTVETGYFLPYEPGQNDTLGHTYDHMGVINYQDEYESDNRPTATEDQQTDPIEQDASETNYGQTEQNADVRAPSPAQSEGKSPAKPGQRTEFHMHGMDGPNSYQFGYDTGKGKHRQFRFEERDNGGRVHGHYGYVGRDGKMRVVHYDADPEKGFHADPPTEQEP